MGFVIESSQNKHVAIEQPARAYEVDGNNKPLNADLTSSDSKNVGIKLETASMGTLDPQTCTLVAFRNVRCSRKCECQCHVQQRRCVRNPEWTRPWLGWFEASYRRRDIERRRLEMQCGCRKDEDLLVEWRPPQFPWARFWMSGSSTLKYSLRQKRVIPWESAFWKIYQVPLELTQAGISKGYSFFHDDCDERGLSLVSVSILIINFQKTSSSVDCTSGPNFWLLRYYLAHIDSMC
jgi:hypothetical protein